MLLGVVDDGGRWQVWLLGVQDLLGKDEPRREAAGGQASVANVDLPSIETYYCQITQVDARASGALLGGM